MAGYTVITENHAKFELKQHFNSGNQASLKKIEKIFQGTCYTSLHWVRKSKAVKISNVKLLVKNDKPERSPDISCR